MHSAANLRHIEGCGIVKRQPLGSRRFGGLRLAAQAQGGDQSAVAPIIDRFQVIQKTTALRNHFQQAAAAVIILLMGLEVLGQVGDPLRQDSDLDFCAARIARGAGVGVDEFGLTFRGNRHQYLLLRG